MDGLRLRPPESNEHNVTRETFSPLQPGDGEEGARVSLNCSRTAEIDKSSEGIAVKLAVANSSSPSIGIKIDEMGKRDNRCGQGEDDLGTVKFEPPELEEAVPADEAETLQLLRAIVDQRRTALAEQQAAGAKQSRRGPELLDVEAGLPGTGSPRVDKAPIMQSTAGGESLRDGGDGGGGSRLPNTGGERSPGLPQCWHPAGIPSDSSAVPQSEAGWLPSPAGISSRHAAAGGMTFPELSRALAATETVRDVELEYDE